MVNAINNSMYTATKSKNGSTIIKYDDPKMCDEECTYKFNKNGSASCVSDAWDTKTKLPKGTFGDNVKNSSPEELVNLYKSYQKDKKLDIQG